eukprot:826215-Amphidinium_carterae.1
MELQREGCSRGTNTKASDTCATAQSKLRDAEEMRHFHTRLRQTEKRHHLVEQHFDTLLIAKTTE